MIQNTAAVKYFLHRLEKPKPLTAFFGTSNTCPVQRMLSCIRMTGTSRLTDSSTSAQPKEKGCSSLFLCIRKQLWALVALKPKKNYVVACFLQKSLFCYIRCLILIILILVKQLLSFNNKFHEALLHIIWSYADSRNLVYCWRGHNRIAMLHNEYVEFIVLAQCTL